ncbi:MAG: sulfatase-like hydrolase/transferase [Planctomycetaceae bacterium]|nr:sulfatase-like hydrolase/transferase [Planctomycetaceae bacterium]
MNPPEESTRRLAPGAAATRAAGLWLRGLAIGAAGAAAALFELTHAVALGERPGFGYGSLAVLLALAASAAVALVGAWLPRPVGLALWSAAAGALVLEPFWAACLFLSVAVALALGRVERAPPLAAGWMVGGGLAAFLLLVPREWREPATVLVLPLCLALGAILLGGALARLPRPALLALAVLGVVGLASRPQFVAHVAFAQGMGPQPATRAAGEVPHVFVLVLDTVRADHLSVYGYERDTTPRLAQLLSDRPGARLYPFAFSNGTWTVPSHATLFSGLLPSQHRCDFGVSGPGGFELTAPRVLAEAFGAGGWATACVFANFWLTKVPGFERGFEHYEYVPHPMGLGLFGEALRRRLVPSLRAAKVVGGALAPDVNRAVLEAFDAVGDRPRFLVANYTDPHSPYVPPYRFRGAFAPWSPREIPRYLSVRLPEAELRRLEARYDEEILALDHSIGELFDELDRRGELDRSWVIVTSDHGEAFGEHGVTEHGTTVHNSVTRVPLLIFPPAGETVPVPAGPVSLVDVAATLAGIAGAELGGPGRDLRRDDGTGGTAVLEFFGDPNKARQHGALAGVPAKVGIQGTDKLIRYAKRAELYDIAKDPAETNDLLPSEPARGEALESLLPDWDMQPPADLDWSSILEPKDLARLRAMGYLGN